MSVSAELTIIVPMAGRGSRFAKDGYTDPKPLIPVLGQPMIRRVIDNLTPGRRHRFIFICQAEHVAQYDMRRRLSEWAPGCVVVELNGITDGAACTVLAARDYIGDGPLMIANSDQYIDVSIDEYLTAQDAGADGLIMTMHADDPKWSFVGFDHAGKVNRVVEKEVISNEATVGIYNFARGSDFVRAADRMIASDLRVNGEFYVAPVYNQLVEEGANIAIYNVGAEANGMYGLGTPADLEIFLRSAPAASLSAST